MVLITASDQKYADAVSNHLKLFDQAVGSDGVTNLSGVRKLDRIMADAGEDGFDYAGNSSMDLEIWPRANNALLVNTLPGVTKKARKRANVTRVFSAITNPVMLVVRACRPHQWMKNLLLFTPLVFSHQFMEGSLFLQVTAGFVSFGLCASGVYLLNDLFDLQHDRQHPTKRSRGLASGAIPLDLAVALIPILLTGAVLVGLALPREFLFVLAAYVVMALAYSMHLKQIAILDVLVLAAMYTIRLIAGGAAAQVTVSYWLLVFSLFFFLGLGMLKRYTEVSALDAIEPGGIAGRGYRFADAGLLEQFGIASGYIAVSVLALYINSDQVKIIYERPEAIWILCPVLLYWISRVWLLAHRGQMHEDPVLFAIRDRVSYYLILLALGILWIAS